MSFKVLFKKPCSLAGDPSGLENGGYEKLIEFGDDYIYDFLESGVLVIYTPDDNQFNAYFAHGVWAEVAATKGHNPGKRQGTLIGRAALEGRVKVFNG